MLNSIEKKNNDSNSVGVIKKEEWYFEVISSDKNFYDGVLLTNGLRYVKYDQNQ